jgi:hypothetical protein
MGAQFSKQTLKVKLKMCSSRIDMFTKKTNLAVARTEQQIAQLLREHKDENARIRMEGVLRQKNTLTACEIISLMAELLGQRLQLIVSQNACSPDLVEAVASIIYCADRIAEIPELKDITQQFALKYTIEWCRLHANNESNCVSNRIIKLLSLRPPDVKLVIKALRTVAESQGIEWEPDESLAEDDQKIGSVVPVISAELPPPISQPALSGQDEIALGNQFAPPNQAFQPYSPNTGQLPQFGGTGTLGQPYPGIFRVTVHKTANLLLNGQAVQHPFVKLSMAGQPVIATAVDHKGGVDPLWGQQLYDFRVQGPGAVLNVEVINQDRVGDVVVGGTVLQVDSNQSPTRTASWIPIQERFSNTQVGSLCLSLQYLTTLEANTPQYAQDHLPEQKQAYVPEFNPLPVNLSPPTPTPPPAFQTVPQAGPLDHLPSVHTKPPPVQHASTDDYGTETPTMDGLLQENDNGQDGDPAEGGAADGAPDFDELERRFRALRG